ncbi:MAG: hypothetical protein WCO56_04280 [Verrucomicrobiota bacterium]
MKTAIEALLENGKSLENGQIAHTSGGGKQVGKQQWLIAAGRTYGACPQ